MARNCFTGRNLLLAADGSANGGDRGGMLARLPNVDPGCAGGAGFKLTRRMFVMDKFVARQTSSTIGGSWPSRA
jgi:hypothetical protein